MRGNDEAGLMFYASLALIYPPTLVPVNLHIAQQTSQFSSSDNAIGSKLEPRTTLGSHPHLHAKFGWQGPGGTHDQPSI